MSRALREGLQMAALGIGVTVVGLVTGAFIMSPSVSREQRMLAVAGLVGTAALALLVYGLGPRLMAFHARRAGRARAAGATPSTIRMSGKASRTPRAVQALAAAGAAPIDIARKTGLPVDAVSMLLELAGPRVAAG